MAVKITVPGVSNLIRHGRDYFKMNQTLLLFPSILVSKTKKFIFPFDYICSSDDKLHADTFKMILGSKLSELWQFELTLFLFDFQI